MSRITAQRRVLDDGPKIALLFKPKEVQLRGAHITVGSSFTFTLAAIARGCQTGNDQGADEEPRESGDVPIDDLSQWLDDQGALIASCRDVCAALIGHAQLTNPLGGELAAQSNRDESAPEEIDSSKIAPLSVERPLYHIPSNQGRRHACWQTVAQGTGGNAIGTWLARASTSEAASVATFHHLALELERLRAPGHFIQKTRQAMADEMRHALRMSSLAERWGAAPGTVTLGGNSERSLFELALQNAEAACATDAYSALVAAVQARRASDPLIRATLQFVSRDALRHTTLAWDLHSWLLSQLSHGEAKLVTLHLENSIARLADELGEGLSASAAQLSVLGLPSKEEHMELALQMGVQVRQLQLCA